MDLDNYRATVGILMLNTHFPRPLGDIGNKGTWDFPVRMRTVHRAHAKVVVGQDPRELLDDFVSAGRSLVAEGCTGIATSCGFLAVLQDELADALGVPFASSPLMQLPMIEAMLPSHSKAGVLTISQENLNASHLLAVGASAQTPVAGLPIEGAFAGAILRDSPNMDFDACRNEISCTAERLVADHNDIGAIVLECTNMAPFAYDVAKVSGLPVYSIVSFLNWFQSGLIPPRFRF